MEEAQITFNQRIYGKLITIYGRAGDLDQVLSLRAVANGGVIYQCSSLWFVCRDRQEAISNEQ